MSPLDSELPILRYIFVHHVREFPFLDKAKEKEFWQDKLQAFLESFASKNISSSEDRLEETKRRKLAGKATKLVELMMVSGVPTSSGFEERIRFSELKVVDSDAIDSGLVSTLPEGHYINGWDVNVAGVRITSIKRNIRYHKHAVSQKEVIGMDITDPCVRNFSSESSAKASWNTLSAGDMATSAVSINIYELNCPGKFFLLFRRRTRRTRLPRDF